MQNKINFIISKAGGNSLSHILAKLKPLGLEADEVSKNMIEIDHACWVNGIWQDLDPFYWQLLKDNQEAKLQDQAPETLESLFKLLGGAE